MQYNLFKSLKQKSKAAYLVPSFALLALSNAIMSCGDGSSSDTSAVTAKAPIKFIDSANMDLSIQPGDDFFEFANGGWLKNTKIPNDKSRWGSFNQLIEDNNDRLHTILENLAKNTDAKKGSKEQNIRDLYKSGMDTAAINAAGIKPINPILEKIDKIATPEDLIRTVSTLHTQGIDLLYSFYVGPDDKNVEKVVPQFAQSGLGMPTKDYYTKTDAKTTKVRDAYKKYIQQILELSGNSTADAATKASKIFEIEKKLAANSLTPVEMRDPEKLYNKFSIKDLDAKTSTIKWGTLLADLKITGQDTILIAMPHFYNELDKQLSSINIEDWKTYLKFHTVSQVAPFLSSDFENAHFELYSKTMSGVEEKEARWKTITGVIDGAVGDQLGQMYVDQYFKPEAKERMLDLVNNLQSTFKDRIQQLDWMSATTKEKALAKLNSFVKKVGYPDVWKDYSKLTITADNYLQNVLNASAFEYDYQISKLGKAVDKKEWFMTPPTVNAYYNPPFNEIVFPAGILQFPFFDFDADDAVNYGGIGAVIGHEMTHGFDDQGRQYDATGNLVNWWTEEDGKKFDAKAKVVIDQFNSFTVLDTIHVNGELTLGENIADLGGLTIAYEAFKKTKQGQSNDLKDGFTPDQRFFLSWAQIWRSKMRDDAAFQQIQTDPHSPGKWRCNGPLSNFEPFYKAFNVTTTNKMFVAPEKRAAIW